MRRIVCLCSALCLFNVYSFDDEMAPTIYADVSQSAINNAVSFDGFHALVGLGFALQEYNSSITNGNNFTSNDMNVFTFIGGFEFAKSFKNNLLIGVAILVDMSQKKKKEGDWQSLNADFDARYAGNKYGKLNTDLLTPSIGVKVGYVFQEHKTAIFAKVGASRVSGSYSYFLNGGKFSDIDVNAVVPTVGLGAEHKLNKQWGISLEANMPVKRISKKTANNVEHRIKVGRTDIRFLGVYSVAGQPHNS